MSKVSVELLRGPEEEEEPKRIHGVVTATVGPKPDPFAQGRVQVMLHFLDTGDLTSWARVASMFAGMLAGSYFVPMPGDEVLVAFEQGDVDKPFIIGALWNLKALPPVPTQLTTIKTIRTQAGNQIVFADVPPSVTIQSSAPAAVPATPAAVSNVVVTPTGVQIVVGATMVMISQANITLQCGGSMLSLSAGGIQILSGAKPVLVQGSAIQLNA
jgi:uncharacterized protein involved in type VI secretion and phage assembly